MIFAIAGIYKITSPSNKIYIGQSVNIKLRWHAHKSDYRNNRYKNKLINSFKKYGFENHTFEIIHVLDRNIGQYLFDKMEQFYIDFYSKRGELLNLKEAGCYGRHSDETKEKLRQIGLGKKLSDETKYKIGLRSKGNKYRLGCKDSIETTLKKSKPVYQYSKDGELITEYISAKEAERAIGIPQTNISENCRGKRKSAGGFVWKFKNSNN